MATQVNPMQPSLFSDRPKRVKLTRKERFAEFHSQNPGVYRILLLRALNLKRQGFKSYSMRTLWEVLRWEMDRKRFRMPTTEKFELNDHHAPFYSRLLMAQHPELQGFFEVRSEGEMSEWMGVGPIGIILFLIIFFMIRPKPRRKP